MKEYRIARQYFEAETVINRSRFIGRCFPAKTEEEALASLAAVRKQHYDATHNCFAYCIGEAGETARFSDDGEPGGTAGLPMMEVLKARGVTNALLVVTRYFGGILLGAGGLVRAYSASAAAALCGAGVVVCRPARRMTLCLGYSAFSALEQTIRAAVQVDSVDYGESVTLGVTVSLDESEAFSRMIVDKSGGRARPVDAGPGLLYLDE